MSTEDRFVIKRERERERERDAFVRVREVFSRQTGVY